ncbi:MAG: DnaJ domain-containing protein, partial [Bacteroidota bacterium]
MTNYYLDILELPVGATPAQIKKAYRRLAKKYHPDLNKSESAKKKFIEIHEAYKFLDEVGPRPTNERVNYDFNPEKSEYDLKRERARAFAKKKAEEAEAYKRKVLSAIYKYFNFVAPVVIICNVILFGDYILPINTFEEQITDHYQVYETIPNTNRKMNTYDVEVFSLKRSQIPPHRR